MLLWKRKLSDRPNGVADPLILGPIITHRGIKELVLAKTSSDNVYAIDADLNRVFWSRSLTKQPSIPDSSCSSDSRVTPSMAPSVIRPKTAVGYEDDFSDGNKPLYVISTDGSLHAFRLRTGEDFAPPLRLFPDSARPTSMDVADDYLYIATASICGGVPDRLWTVGLKNGGRATGFSAQQQLIKEYDRDIVGDTDAGSFKARTAFGWQGQELMVGITGAGELAFRDAKSQPIIFGLPSSGNSPTLATGKDAAGNRWVYANLQNSIKAFRLTQRQTQLELEQGWTSSGLNAPGPPVLANGILYFLSSAGATVSSHLVLHAVDALEGRELYNSGESICSNSSSKNLAIANGHISFSATDGWLYCFAIPFQQ